MSASVLALIIWPKVKRVRSGDKIVMSKLLGAQYSASNVFQMNPEINPSMAGLASPSTLEPERISLHRYEAVPRHIEKKIYFVQSVLRSVTSQW